MLHLLPLPWVFVRLRRASLLPGLLLLGAWLAGSPALAQRAFPRPLPPALAALLPTTYPASDTADIRRLWAARRQWGTDSLGQLLVFARLGYDYGRLQQSDSLYHYLTRAWRLAGTAQRRRQPAEVVGVAKSLAIHHYSFGAYDSTRYYFRQASHLFRAGRLDSTRQLKVLLPSTELWAGGGTLAGILANTGSASRALGDLPDALRCYERATALYQARHDLGGLSWAQSLLGETYAEQDNAAQAQLLYEQALRTAHAYSYQTPFEGSMSLSDVLLNYYAPLLLTQPNQLAHVARLAASVRQALLANYPAAEAQRKLELAHALLRVNLLLAHAALQGHQPAAAALTRARHWLHYSTHADTTAAHWHDLYYAELRADYLGLLAWQQHPHNPAAARRLLAEAATLLGQGGAAYPLRQQRQQLAGYCVSMHEPGPAVRLLRPLLATYQHSGSAYPLSQITGLLTQAYEQAGRFDSAYYFSHRTQGLTDTVREGRQFAALAAAEARFRSREQAGQIRLLTQLGEHRTRMARLTGAGAVLLALLALGLGLAWRKTRQLNCRLAAQAERLGELDEAKNQFFANVSHELRTPLTLVLGPLEGLLTGPDLPAAVRQPVALAHHQAQRLLRLVNRILDLTKLQAGRLALSPAPTELAGLLRRVVAQFESLATQRGIALHGPEMLPGSLPLLLDADKVEEVLTNLLINALNHTPAGGTVRVSAALPDPADGLYRLTVQDTGPGIAPAEQARVFERYYQTHQRHAQGGTGLGLALSRELAQLLGGTLTLASEPGQGAAFTLCFPAEVLPTAELPTAAEVPEPATPPAQPPAVEPTAPRARVLVVEDQPDLREYLRSLLAPTHEVLTAPDGQAALELLAAEAPVDLIATDAMMPHLSGTELLAQLRADPARYHAAGVPVLMLTARADEAHRLTAITVGVDDYLTKPFVAAELLARVRVLLARRQVRRQFAALPPELPAPATALPERDSRRPDDGAITVAAPPAIRRKRAPVAPAAQLGQWQALAASRLADERFGPAELADLLCLSERTLYRRLGELAGLTPAAWLRELRLDQARQLLEAGSFGSVAEVADAVGFASAKYFASIYTERFGRRPGDYRG